jgi:hypothetical protein
LAAAGGRGSAGWLLPLGFRWLLRRPSMECSKCKLRSRVELSSSPSSRRTNASSAATRDRALTITPRVMVTTIQTTSMPVGLRKLLTRLRASSRTSAQQRPTGAASPHATAGRRHRPTPGGRARTSPDTRERLAAWSWAKGGNPSRSSPSSRRRRDPDHMG